MCTHIPGLPQCWPAVCGRAGAPRWCPKPGPAGTAPSLALGQLGSKGGHATFAKGFSLFPSPAWGCILGSESSGAGHETQTWWAYRPKGISFQQALEVAKLSFESPQALARAGARSLPTPTCASPRQGERMRADRIPHCDKRLRSWSWELTCSGCN